MLEEGILDRKDLENSEVLVSFLVNLKSWWDAPEDAYVEWYFIQIVSLEDLQVPTADIPNKQNFQKIWMEDLIL